MKKSLLFVLAFIIVLPAMASVTVQESTEAEYLINAGYSQATAEDVFMQKNRVNGKPIEPLYTKSNNKFVNWWNSAWAYIDPAMEENDKLHHDIKLSPSYSDL